MTQNDPNAVVLDEDPAFDRVFDRRDTDSLKWRMYPEDVLPMWLADMDFRSPEPVIRALHDRIEHGFFGYNTEDTELREILAGRLEELYSWRVPVESIVFVPGVIPGYNLACRAMAAPGDGLLFQTPLYYPMLRVPGHIGLRADEAELSRGEDGRYQIDFEVFARAIKDRTRVFLLCSPHNPVGRVFEYGELARMAELCLQHDIGICADEIHCDLLFDGRRHIPIASLDKEVEQRTITLMSPSKTFNLPGLRCAAAIIPNPDLRARFVAAHVDLVKPVNVLGYAAMMAAYRDGGPWLERLLRYLHANRSFVQDFVKRELPGISMAMPEGTYFAWLDCREARLPLDDPYEFFLREARVALSEGPKYGAGGKGFARLTFASPREMLRDALARMANALSRHRTG
jgi:cystathionine beta-lyase